MKSTIIVPKIDFSQERNLFSSTCSGIKPGIGDTLAKNIQALAATENGSTKLQKR